MHVKMKLKRAASLKKISMKINSKRLNEACDKKTFQVELSNRFSPQQFFEAVTGRKIAACKKCKRMTGSRIQTEAVQAMGEG